MSKLLLNVVPLLLKTAFGLDVTKEADRKGLTDVLGNRPAWLQRRFIAGVLMVISAIVAGVYGVQIPEGEINGLEVALDNAIPGLIAVWSAVLGIWGYIRKKEPNAKPTKARAKKKAPRGLNMMLIVLSASLLMMMVGCSANMTQVHDVCDMTGEVLNQTADIANTACLLGIAPSDKCVEIRTRYGEARRVSVGICHAVGRDISPMEW